MPTKTVSLETAKALKENGFKQDSYFFWARRAYIINGGHYKHAIFISDEHGNIDKISAPTTDELLEELPTAHEHLGNLMFKKVIRKKIVKYKCCYGNQDSSPHFENESLSEVLSQMWLHLKKEGII